MQDIGYALRSMAGNPLFASIAVLSLALGIGANTAIYSFMEAILMRSLPVRNPESLVVFKWHSKDFPPVAHSFNGGNYKDAKTGFTSGNFPYPAFEPMRANNAICSSVLGFSRAGRLRVYLPYGQRPSALYGMNYELRSAGDPMALAETVRRMVHQADSRIPVADVSTQSGIIDQTISQERTFATLCTWFALLAVPIACVGLYGTMAYSVARRTNEIGVRWALGVDGWCGWCSGR